MFTEDQASNPPYTNPSREPFNLAYLCMYLDNWVKICLSESCMAVTIIPTYPEALAKRGQYE